MLTLQRTSLSLVVGQADRCVVRCPDFLLAAQPGEEIRPPGVGSKVDLAPCIVFEVKDGRIVSGRESCYDLSAWDDFWA